MKSERQIVSVCFKTFFSTAYKKAQAWICCSKIADSIGMIPQDTLISKQKIQLLKSYVDTRLKENNLMIDTEKHKENTSDALDSIRVIIRDKLDSIRYLKR